MLSTHLGSVSLPLPVRRADPGRRALAGPRSGRHLLAPFRTSETFWLRLLRTLSSPRAPRLYLGAPPQSGLCLFTARRCETRQLWGGGRYRENSLGAENPMPAPSCSGEQQRDPAAGLSLGSFWCCCSPGWPGSAAGQPFSPSGFPLVGTALLGEGGRHFSSGDFSPFLSPSFLLPPFLFIHKPGGYKRSLNIDVSSPNCSSVNPITEFIKNCVELSLSIQYQH